MMDKLSENKSPARNWIKVALINFFLAALLGTTLRLAFVVEISWLNYRYILHTHSHIAMLGWLYLAFYALLIQYFLPPQLQKQPFYHRLFWTTQLSVIGMLCSFPFQGYGPVSISFSTLHVVCSYIFIGKFLKDLSKSKVAHQQSRLLTKWSLGFLVISTLGLWGMGPVMALGLRATAWYNMAVQFYLHFQFNGWFLFAAIAIFFQISLNQGLSFDPRRFRQFTRLMVIATIVTYSLILAWTNPKLYFFTPNSVGVVLQLVALFLLFKMLQPYSRKWEDFFSIHELYLFWVAAIAFVLRVFIQVMIFVPYLAKIGYTIRNFMIGFIHLLLLGMASHFAISAASRQNLLQLKPFLAKWGMLTFFGGFLLSELLLFTQGIFFWGNKGFIPFYYEILFTFSALMPLGIGMLLFGQSKHSKKLD